MEGKTGRPVGSGWARQALKNQVLTEGAFVSAGGSWNLIAFTDLRICLGEFIERNHGPVDPAWEVGS